MEGLLVKFLLEFRISGSGALAFWVKGFGLERVSDPIESRHRAKGWRAQLVVFRGLVSPKAQS